VDGCRPHVLSAEAVERDAAVLAHQVDHAVEVAALHALQVAIQQRERLLRDRTLSPGSAGLALGVVVRLLAATAHLRPS